MLAIVLGRLKSVLEHIDEVDESGNIDPAIKRKILALHKRTDVLGKCIYLLLLGGICVLALLAYMSVGAVFKIEKLYGAGLLFLAANVLVAGALFMFAMDVRMEMTRTLRLRRRRSKV
jgi:hypothetical protein